MWSAGEETSESVLTTGDDQIEMGEDRPSMGMKKGRRKESRLGSGFDLIGAGSVLPGMVFVDPSQPCSCWLLDSHAFSVSVS